MPRPLLCRRILLLALALAGTTIAAAPQQPSASVDVFDDTARRAAIVAAQQRAAAGDRDAARAALRALLAQTEARPDPAVRLSILVPLGTLEGQSGNYAEAGQVVAEALDLAGRTGNQDALITGHNTLGVMARLQGDYDTALAEYEQALRIAEAANRQDAIGRVLNNLGVVAQIRGDMRAAQDYFTRSLALKQTAGLPADLIGALHNLGTVHHYQGNYAQALDYYAQARDLAFQLGSNREAGMAISNSGNIYIRQGRYDEARQALDRALGLVTGVPIQIATIEYDRGLLAMHQHRWDDAAAALERSLAARETLNDRFGMAESLEALGEVALMRGNPAAALAFAERAVATARTGEANEALWSSLALRGRAQMTLGQTDAAVASLEESIDLTERLRQQVAGGAQDVQRFLSEKSAAYDALAVAHALRGDTAAAFNTVERARARVLLDIIAGGKPIVRTLSDNERARERDLNRRIGLLNAQRTTLVSQKAPADRVTAIEDDLARARRARDQWEFDAYAAHPDLRFSRGEAAPLTLADAAPLIPRSGAIVLFLSTNDRVWRLLLTRAADGAARLELRKIDLPSEDLADRAYDFSQRIARRDLAFAKPAREMYDVLLGDLDARLTGLGQLVIVPDGPLWEVPFQALQTPRGRFLIEEHAISYAPSVTALGQLERRRASRASRPARLVALGDPAGASLPEARREVQQLATLYGASSRAFVGADATEDKARQLTADATVLHIATHGEMIGANPMYSYVALAPGQDAIDPSHDGRLEAWEIANLPLSADLVVLSACETARGGTLGGEGVVGLSWSLFAAGASTSVVSLWRVDSAGTTRLMLDMHRRLRTAVSPAVAMRAAARQMLATPEYRHPFYWAGFVVIGAP